LRRDEPEHLGFVGGSGELLGVEDVGEVDERAGRCGARDAVVGGGVGLFGTVDVDAAGQHRRHRRGER
jgi:hypothetical protein